MTNATRRSFLRQSSVAGVATIGVLAVAPGAVTRRPLPDVPPVKIALERTAEPFVAFVRNAAEGEIAFQIGEREVVVRDAELVARMLQAAR